MFKYINISFCLSVRLKFHFEKTLRLHTGYNFFSSHQNKYTQNKEDYCNGNQSKLNEEPKKKHQYPH